MFVEITDKRGLIIPINTTHIGYYYTKSEPKPTCVLQMQGGKVMNAEFDTEGDLNDFIDLINSSGSGGGGGGTPSIKDGGLVQKPTEKDFPVSGDPKNVYLAQDTDKAYYWSVADSKYKEFAGGGKGVAVLEKDITSNKDCGAAPAGSFFPENMTFTQFAEKILRTEVAPIITATFTNTGFKEVGTVVKGTTMTVKITNLSLVTKTINSINFSVGMTLANSQAFVPGKDTYTFNYTSNIDVDTTAKVECVYDTTQIVRKTGDFKFVYASYVSAVGLSTITDADATAIATSGTKVIKDTKAYTWNNISLNDEKFCYLYPASFGTLSDIKDGNGFSQLAGYTLFNVNVTSPVNGDIVAYNAYMLTDPTTGTGFKQIYS